MEGRKYRHFSIEERCEIARRRDAGQSLRKIAAALDRSPSSIARELKRNSSVVKGYLPKHAGEQAHARRWKGSKLERKPELQATVLELLKRGCSPENVSGRLALETGRQVISHETIYRFVYAQITRAKNYAWRHYLPRGKAKRGLRGRKGGSSARLIEHRIPIAQRPAIDRSIAGHWEADTIQFARTGQTILALHERSTRLMWMPRLPSKRPPRSPSASRLPSVPCRPIFAAPSPSTTARNSRTTTACANPCSCKLTSAIRTRPGRKAASRTPLAASVADYRERPI